ncbi:MAG: hypothetical protein AB1439_05175 [candidate division FCPU426 bacterium]
MRFRFSHLTILYGLAAAVYASGFYGTWAAGFPRHLAWPGAAGWLLAFGLGMSVCGISQALTFWAGTRWLGLAPERAGRLAAWLDLPFLLLPAGLLAYPWLAAWGSGLQMDVLGNLFPFWRPAGHYRMAPAGYLLLLWAGPWLTLTVFLKMIFGVRLFLRKYEGAEDRMNVRLPVLFGAAAVFFVLLSCWTTLVYPPTGDEPHYLLMSQSLLSEGDIDLNDNYTRADYRAYYPTGTLDRHLSTGRTDQAISNHFPLLSILILPGFMLLGRFGAVLVVCLMAAAAATGVYVFSRGWGSDKPTALWSWLLAVVSVPLAVYFDLIYPELPAALMLILGLWGWHRGGSRGTLLLALAIAVLPWIYPKYIPLAVLLTLLLPTTPRATIADLAAAVALLGLSGWGYYVFFHSYYGFTPGANPYRLWVDSPEGVWAFPWSLRSLRNALGLLVDRDFGVLATAPALLLAVPGWLRLRRTNLRSAVVVAAVFLVQYLLFIVFDDYTGSAAVFSRQMIVAVILCLPLVPLGWKAVRPGWKWLAGLWVGAGIGLAWISAAWPMLRYAAPKSMLWQKLGFAPLLFPSLMPAPSAADYLWAAAWLLAMAGLLLFMLKPAAAAADNK